MSRNRFPRAFLAASSTLILLIAVSPVALAAGQGKSGDHGKKANKSTVDSILKAIQDSPVFNGKGKKFENDGKALEGQTGSLLKKLAKIGASNPAVLVAINTYTSSVDTATAIFQSAIKAAKTVYKSALETATTDDSKQSAETAFKAAIALAQQAFNTTITAANLGLKTALTANLGFAKPSPSPSSA